MAKVGSKEFAELIQKTPARIRQMITNGEIEAQKIGRDWIIDTDQIEAAKNLPNRRISNKGLPELKHGGQRKKAGRKKQK